MLLLELQQITKIPKIYMKNKIIIIWFLGTKIIIIIILKTTLYLVIIVVYSIANGDFKSHINFEKIKKKTNK
jgi:hypothetical protein